MNHPAPMWDLRQDQGVIVIQRSQQAPVSVLHPESPWVILDRLLGDSPNSIYLIDFSLERYLTSEALGVLVNLVRRVQQAGGRLVIAGPTPPVLGVLESTRLSRLVTVAPDMATARTIV